MKYLFCILILFLSFANSFSQDSKFKSSLLTSKNKFVTISNDSDTILEIEKVLLPTNKRVNYILTSTLRWGFYGGSAGLLTAYIMDLNDECDKGLCYIFVPTLGASIGVISGLIHSAISDTKQDFDASKLDYGLQIHYETVFSDQRKYGESIGIAYRRSNTNFYIPNNYYIYFAQEEWDTRPGDSQSSSSEFNQTKHGIELTKINYEYIFSFVYGIGVGYSSGTLREHISEPIYKTINKINYESIYINIIFGVNMNIFKFLHFQLYYKYEPYGPYNKIKGNYGFTNSIQHSISFSAKCFLF